MKAAIIVPLVAAGVVVAVMSQGGSIAGLTGSNEGVPEAAAQSDASGGGAPLPLAGVTLVGQAVGAGGLYLLVRRRRRKPKSKGMG